MSDKVHAVSPKDAATLFPLAMCGWQIPSESLRGDLTLLPEFVRYRGKDRCEYCRHVIATLLASGRPLDDYRALRLL